MNLFVFNHTSWILICFKLQINLIRTNLKSKFALLISHHCEISYHQLCIFFSLLTFYIFLGGTLTYVKRSKNEHLSQSRLIKNFDWKYLDTWLKEYKLRKGSIRLMFKGFLWINYLVTWSKVLVCLIKFFIKPTCKLLVTWLNVKFQYVLPINLFDQKANLWTFFCWVFKECFWSSDQIAFTIKWNFSL